MFRLATAGSSTHSASSGPKRSTAADSSGESGKIGGLMAVTRLFFRPAGQNPTADYDEHIHNHMMNQRLQAEVVSQHWVVVQSRHRHLHGRDSWGPARQWLSQWR